MAHSNFVDNEQKSLDLINALNFNVKKLKIYLGLKDLKTAELILNRKKRLSKVQINRILRLEKAFPFKSQVVNEASDLKFIDLFSGIGGFRLAWQNLGGQCVYSSEIDPYAQTTYFENFGEWALDDIRDIQPESVPDHDLLCAGFPCQAFSQVGLQKGFADERGILFFYIYKILLAKKPKMILLENVSNLRNHNGGHTFSIILRALQGQLTFEDIDNLKISRELKALLYKKLNYHVVTQVISPIDFNIPQRRKRVFFMCFNKDYYDEQVLKNWKGIEFEDYQTNVGSILEDISGDAEKLNKFTLQDGTWDWMRERVSHQKAKGNNFKHNIVNRDSKCTNAILARYYKDGAEALVDQSELGLNPRKLTHRECARLQGFPDEFIIDAVSSIQMYKQFGNGVCSKLVEKIGEQMLKMSKIATKNEL